MVQVEEEGLLVCWRILSDKGEWAHTHSVNYAFKDLPFTPFILQVSKINFVSIYILNLKKNLEHRFNIQYIYVYIAF